MEGVHWQIPPVDLPRDRRLPPLGPACGVQSAEGHFIEFIDLWNILSRSFMVHVVQVPSPPSLPRLSLSRLSLSPLSQLLLAVRSPLGLSGAPITRFRRAYPPLSAVWLCFRPPSRCYPRRSGVPSRRAGDTHFEADQVPNRRR
jgi:hypothetical protein